MERDRVPGDRPRSFYARDSNGTKGHELETLPSKRGTLNDDTSHKLPGQYDKLNLNPKDSDPTSQNLDFRDNGGGSRSARNSQNLDMGVKNLGYHGENHPRSRTSLSPYAIDTPGKYSNVPNITTASNGPAIQTPNTGIEVKRPVLTEPKKPTYSEYSSISDVMPYVLPNERRAEYEYVPSHLLNNIQNTDHRPSLTQSRKKQNLIYGSSPHKITDKSKAFRKYERKKLFGHCKLVLLIFIGLVAIAAMLIALLLIFGIISARKCTECGNNTPNIPVDASTPSDLKLHLSYLQGNLSILRDNTHLNLSTNMALLQRELEEQRNVVQQLTNELQQQRQLTNELNISVYNVSCMKGEKGAPGFNGTKGQPGTVFNSSLCEFQAVTTSGQNKIKAWADDTPKKYNTNISCGFNGATGISMKKLDRDTGVTSYFCECVGPDQDEIECVIYYWTCPDS